MKLNILFYSLLFIGLYACSKEKDEQPAPNVPATPRTVQYRIACTDCEVIYYKENNVQATEMHMNGSWTYTYEGNAGDTALLFAYNTSGAAQGVSVCILLNSDTLQEQTNFCPISGYSFVVSVLQ
jgi:hypothetical protein